MSTDQRDRLLEILELLASLPESRRADAARLLCGDDVSLRAKVDEALSAQAQDQLLERLAKHAASEPDRPPINTPATNSFDRPYDEAVGRTIGVYKLLERLGEGGFGEVFAAEQTEPIKRRVAMKIIKQGMDSRAVVARFEAERQALAMMDHPNIAKVLDAGTTPAGRPYFVMELVRGVSINKYCEENRLSPRERIELMIPVCKAIQHAHQKGIIHRDIKPSNVLVTILDGNPVPKVIDFGIAKAIAGASTLTDKTVYTAFRQFIGTPAYMSPEQILQSGTDVDTRSDVYALGVLMYELLSGSLPFDTESLLREGLERMQQVVRDQDPPKPSTRVMTMDAGKRTSIAAARRLLPDKLGGALRGEVDWMVMKAVEKDRNRRYQSPTEFAEDLQRFLAGDAVKASPPSGWYRARKFVRRNRGLFTGVSAVIVTLAIGLIAVAWQARIVSRQRDLAVDARRAEAVQREHAEVERERAGIVSSFMSDMLSGAGPAVARGRDAALLKDLMRGAVERIEKKELTKTPDAELSLRSTIGNTYREIAAYDDAKRVLVPAVELSRASHAGDHAATVLALLNMGELLVVRGEYSDAKPVLTECLEMSRRLRPEGSVEIARALNALALTAQRLGDLVTAESFAHESLLMMQRHGPGLVTLLADSFEGLGGILREKGDSAGAEKVLRELLALRRSQAPGDDPRVANTLNNLSTLLTDRHDLDGAEALTSESLSMMRRLYKDGHPDLGTALNSAGFLRAMRGDGAGAEKFYREALAMRKRLYPGDHPDIAQDMNNIGETLQKRGDLDGAEPYFREALAMQRRLFPAGNTDVAYSLNMIAGVQRKRGDLAGAETLLRECLEMRRRLYPKDHYLIAVTLDNIGIVLRDRGDYAGSETLVNEAIEIKRRTLGNEHPITLISDLSLAEVYIAQGKYRETIDLLAPLIDTAREAFPGENAPRAILMLMTLANARMLLANSAADPTGWNQAESDYLRAYADTLENLGQTSTLAGSLRKRLAEFYERRAIAEPGKGHEAQATKWKQEPASNLVEPSATSK
jgi:eukaryotic-like serine/threonine-protein kinase